MKKSKKSIKQKGFEKLQKWYKKLKNFIDKENIAIK